MHPQPVDPLPLDYARVSPADVEKARRLWQSARKSFYLFSVCLVVYLGVLLFAWRSQRPLLVSSPLAMTAIVAGWLGMGSLIASLIFFIRWRIATSRAARPQSADNQASSSSVNDG